MRPAAARMPLCTIELIADGHAERCPGDECAFWADGCVLERVEDAISGRPAVAALLLELRREVESGLELDAGAATARLDGALEGPAG